MILGTNALMMLGREKWPHKYGEKPTNFASHRIQLFAPRSNFRAPVKEWCFLLFSVWGFNYDTGEKFPHYSGEELTNTKKSNEPILSNIQKSWFCPTALPKFQKIDNKPITILNYKKNYTWMNRTEFKNHYGKNRCAKSDKYKSNVKYYHLPLHPMSHPWKIDNNQ